MSTFDVAAYQLELASAAFESARARLAAHGWELTPGNEAHFRAVKRFDALREILLPSLDGLEEACRSYDEAQEARAGAARERAREAQRLEQEAQLEASLARSVRQAEQAFAEEEARRANL